MQIKSLACTNPSFKTLNFGAGLNIIAGLQSSKDSKDSYNGVGKSLSLQLLHLMLGSDLKDKTLKKALTEYGTFTLTFIHDGISHSVEKDFGKDGYTLDNVHMPATQFSVRLDEIFGTVGTPISARQIFRVFMREYGGAYYNDALTQFGMSLNDFHQRKINLFLLGIDLDLINQRKEIKEKIAKLDQAKSIIEEYAPTSNQINTKDLLDELSRLQILKSKFRIAKNHDEIMDDCDNLTEKLNGLRNDRHKLSRDSRLKKRLIDALSASDIDSSEITSLYNEAKHYFPDKIVRRISDAIKFHKQLTTQRIQRIELEQKAIDAKISLLSNEIHSVELARDKAMKLIGHSGALNEYFALIKRIEDVNSEIQEATKYEEMKKQFSIDKSKLQADNASIKEKSIVYLDDKSELLDKLDTKFRLIVKRFYANSGGSLKITETKDAKYLYDIKIEIPKDRSQGVGEVKIFCYDMLLYLLNRGVFGFMAHDGCLYSEMDPRQKASMIKVVQNVCAKHKLQYFVNMNQNTFNEIAASELLDENEKKSFKESVILKLFDAKPQNSLLGISF